MSNALEQRIRAIMEGKADLKKDEGDKNLDNNSDNSGDTNEAKDGTGIAAKQAKKDAIKNSNFELRGEPEVGKGKSDKAEVKEGATPDCDSELSGVGKETSKEEDNNKINDGKGRKLGDKFTVKQPIKTDNQDDNGDNAKIKKGLSQREAGHKLSSPQKEHIEVLFDGEDLTEKFKEKAETIFEAAVAYAVEQKDEELQEQYQSQLDEAIEEAKGELVEQIDGYLDYVVEQWLEDNAVALESGVKVELVNSFIEGIKTVFQEHYVEIPEDKIDVIEAQAEQIETLEAEVNALRESYEEATSEKLVIQCEDALVATIKGLTAIEEEKFRSLAENVEFDSIDEFTEKVGIIRDSYFKGINSSQDVTKPITEVKKESNTVNAVLETLQKGTLKFVR